MLRDQLIEEILADPDAPQEMRIALQLGRTGKRISTKLSEAVFEIGLKTIPGCSQKELLDGKRLLEYLQLMEVGFDSFMAAHHAK